MSNPSQQPTAATTAKERHYAHLAAKLQSLSHNLANTQHHLAVASEQAHYVRKLGGIQAALFMAALHQVDQEAAAGASQEGEGDEGHAHE